MKPKKDDRSKSVEKAVRWRVCDRVVQVVKDRNQDISAADLEGAIDRAIRDVRNEMRRATR